MKVFSVYCKMEQDCGTQVRTAVVKTEDEMDAFVNQCRIEMNGDDTFDWNYTEVNIEVSAADIQGDDSLMSGKNSGRSLEVATPLGGIRAYAKSDSDCAEDYPGVYIDWVDTFGLPHPLAVVEYDPADHHIQLLPYSEDHGNDTGDKTLFPFVKTRDIQLADWVIALETMSVTPEQLEKEILDRATGSSSSDSESFGEIETEMLPHLLEYWKKDALARKDFTVELARHGTLTVTASTFEGAVAAAEAREEDISWSSKIKIVSIGDAE